jgi:hypothetical protein
MHVLSCSDLLMYMYVLYSARCSLEEEEEEMTRLTGPPRFSNPSYSMRHHSTTGIEQDRIDM